MQPAVPAGRRRRAFALAAIDHPAPLEAERRVDLAADRAVIGVAELVVAHDLAEAAGPEAGVHGRAGPPGREAEESRLERDAVFGRGRIGQRAARCRMRCAGHRAPASGVKAGAATRPSQGYGARPAVWTVNHVRDRCFAVDNSLRRCRTAVGRSPAPDADSCTPLPSLNARSRRRTEAAGSVGRRVRLA